LRLVSRRSEQKKIRTYGICRRIASFTGTGRKLSLVVLVRSDKVKKYRHIIRGWGVRRCTFQ
jgi:hypothetical protein